MVTNQGKLHEKVKEAEETFFFLQSTELKKNPFLVILWYPLMLMEERLCAIW